MNGSSLSYFALMTISAGCLVPHACAQTSNSPPDRVSSTAGQLSVKRLAPLEYPWGMDRLPDGRLLISEKPGRLRIWDGDKLSSPVEGVPKVVNRGKSDQGGLMDVAVDPEFGTNHFVYLSFSEASDTQSDAFADTGDIRFADNLDLADNILRGGAVARGKLEGNRLREMQVIWRQTPKTIGRGHFGNRLVFDKSGKLFVTSGDRMRFDPAQSLESNLGKVLRINRDGSIPEDNPFVGKNSACGDIWSYGHRNVLSAAIDPSSDKLWVVEMGPLGGDELNLISRGKNYGWPQVSDGDNYAGPMIPDHSSSDKYEKPVRAWTPVISPSGATFYRGSRFQGWKGSMLIGGLSSKALVRLTFQDDQVAVEERMPMQRRIRDVLEDSDGTLLLLVDAQEGELLRLTPER